MITAIVGGNWGDEGKGKMTDLFADGADMVMRFQGGANAGHTIINKYGKFVLHMLPSGVFHPGTVNLISNGTAFSPECMFKELKELEEGGVPTPDVRVSDRAQIVMPYHIAFDALEEERLGKNSFGSTKSGIAPFYADKAMKIGFQVAELYNPNLDAKIKRVVEIKNLQGKALYGDKFNLTEEELTAHLKDLAEKLAPYRCEAAYLINDFVKENKKILLEGQLGTLRDPDNGIYPYCTSSSPLAGNACVGGPVPFSAIEKVVTVVKAYSSCVGAGAFVTEIFDEEADELRRRGGSAGEFGATTGRPRRMGWFDAVATRYGCMVQGTTDVALSIIDVLGYLDKIPVCVAYEIDGVKTDRFPAADKLDRAKPVYEYLDGWKCDLSGIRKFEDLPVQAQNYVKFIEERIGFPITMISNGPDRYDVIYR